MRASAVYGSDAITSVVNFIMRDDFGDVEAIAQTSYEADFQHRSHRRRHFAECRGNAVVSVALIMGLPLIEREPSRTIWGQ